MVVCSTPTVLPPTIPTATSSVSTSSPTTVGWASTSTVSTSRSVRGWTKVARAVARRLAPLVIEHELSNRCFIPFFVDGDGFEVTGDYYERPVIRGLIRCAGRVARHARGVKLLFSKSALRLDWLAHAADRMEAIALG